MKFRLADTSNFLCLFNIFFSGSPLDIIKIERNKNMNSIVLVI